MAKKSPHPIDKHVGSRVRMRRLMLGISQEKLGDALGLTFQQVQKYEKGTNRISASRLVDISDVLQVPVQFFFEGMPKKPKLTLVGKQPTPPADYTGTFFGTTAGHTIARNFPKIKDVTARNLIVGLIAHLGGEVISQESEEKQPKRRVAR